MSDAGTATPRFSPPRSLYVHVPVCSAKCRYCDFFSLPVGSVSESGLTSLVSATIARACDLAERFGAASFRTLYVGGGTPTALPLELMARLLEGLGPLAAPSVEWTVEANPESLSPEHLDLFLRHGVTRVSVGVQSLDDAELGILGRPHDAQTARAALRRCVDAGLAVSADLISGIPSSPRRDALADSVAQVLDLGVGHLSIYDLSVEEGTALAELIGRGELRLPDSETAYRAWERAVALLETRGFRRYEVANFAPPGGECRHNLGYWTLDSYLGVGPGGVSTLVGAPASGGASLRIEEGRSLDAYCRLDFGGAKESAIAPRESAFEALMMGFRTIFGVEYASFSARFGVALEALVGRSLERWARRLRAGERLPAARGDARRVALDSRGLDLLNRFLVDCLAELEARFPDRPGAIFSAAARERS